MNSRNSLIVLIAILLLVGQLVTKDSTLMAVAGADTETIQQSMKNGEENLKQMASTNTTPARSGPIRTAESLDDFYGNDEIEIPDYEAPPELTDVDDDEARPQPVTRSASPKPKIIADTVNGVPIMPRIP